MSESSGQTSYVVWRTAGLTVAIIGGALALVGLIALIIVHAQGCVDSGETACRVESSQSTLQFVTGIVLTAVGLAVFSHSSAHPPKRDAPPFVADHWG